jgi:hypothetical protein
VATRRYKRCRQAPVHVTVLISFGHGQLAASPIHFTQGCGDTRLVHSLDLLATLISLDVVGSRAFRLQAPHHTLAHSSFTCGCTLSAWPHALFLLPTTRTLSSCLHGTHPSSFDAHDVLSWWYRRPPLLLSRVTQRGHARTTATRTIPFAPTWPHAHTRLIFEATHTRLPCFTRRTRINPILIVVLSSRQLSHM